MKMMYIDPGTGSMLISALIALISVGFFMVKGFIYQKLNIGGDKNASKGANIDLSHPYGLVFYSEGKQYWNVFKPVLEECSRRGIHATYFTSDENDPGLESNFEYIETKYIGNGREAFYVLNRMTADMVVMTTPGLDVLEIKRSKNVKHYSHITHAPGCIAGYKAYSVDYFDSVLLGGDGDLTIIPELEEKRNLPEKELKVIGHTYLDEYRKKLSDQKYQESFFTDNRPVVLISPTWSNHGLLTKYGKQILSSLEKTDQYNIIIRPHPQSFISEVDMVEELIASFPNNEHRKWDREIDGLISMSQADIMISDFSGIIFDFVSLFEKPILTMHSHYEKRGRDASDIAEDPWDLQIVETLGRALTEADIDKLPTIIDESLAHSLDISKNVAQVKQLFDKYPNEAAVRGVDFISEKLAEIQANAPVEPAMHAESYPISLNNLAYENLDKVSLGGKLKETVKMIFAPTTFLQFTLASMLLNIYIYLAQWFLPAEGLNQEFLGKILPYSLMILLVLFTLTIILSWITDKGQITFKKEFEAIELKDFLLLALPLAPIIQYIVANQDILSLNDSLKVFGFFFAITLVFVVVVPFLISPVLAKSVSLPVSFGFLFIILNMASFGRKIWPVYVGLILAALLIVSFFLLFYKQKNILVVASLVFFATNLGVSFFNEDDLDAGATPHDIKDEDSRIMSVTADKTPVRTPDVLLLVYESYSNEETMDYYGFDNSEQTQYLLDNGFAIYDGTYSLGPSSLESITRVLEPDYQSASLDAEKMRELIGAEASALRLFNEIDYITHGAVSNDYMTKGVTPHYHHFFPDARYSIDPHTIIIEAILEGEFRFDADFSTTDYETYVHYKREVLTENLSKPEFLYTHNNYPGHSQNSGVLLPNETELHIEGIVRANEEMRADIEAIQLENRDAIVIVAGDHGPYLTKNGIGLNPYPQEEINRIDIQDRYGAFLAIHWPERGYEEKYDIQILQDILPAVTAYLYADDTLFDQIRMERQTTNPYASGGVKVEDGIIIGGSDDGQPLFDEVNVRFKPYTQ